MATQTGATLKGYFNTGDQPTESNFEDLIDSSLNLIASHETVEGGNGGGSATALSITTSISFITTATNKSHVSLADGTTGQIKHIIHKTRSNSVDLVITPANLSAGSTLTSNLGGRGCTLIFDGTNWQVLGDVGEFVIA